MKHQQFITLVKIFENKNEVSFNEAVKILQIKREILSGYLSLLADLGLNLKKQTSEAEQLTSSAIDYLNPVHISEFLTPRSKELCNILPIKLSIDSTNRYLIRTKPEFKHQWRVCLAEYQTDGRGRRGKRWVSPISSNIYMSLHCRLNMPLSQLGGVSLVVGIAIVNALKKLNIDGLMIKWPNDIYHNEKKIAGILIESTRLKDDSADLVVGIGLNVNMQAEEAATIDQAWTSINQINTNKISRNELIAEIINQLTETFSVYEKSGLAAYESDWKALDYLKGKQVIVHDVIGNNTTGTALGINDVGELLIETSLNKTIAINAGEVSVRTER